MKLSPKDFMHPKDQAALEHLKAIPAFDQIVKKILAMGFEQYQYGINMASRIRLSERQLPEIYKHLPPICEKLGIPEPELYLQMSPEPNAWTAGDTRVYITLTSSLLEYMTDEELDAIIAHECGHIFCHHVLYKTIAYYLQNMADALGLLGTFATPVKLALSYWERMSELSADRAAAIVTSPEVLSSTMVRLAGGPKSITQNINYDEWMKQAYEYERICNDGVINKAMQLNATLMLDHPFCAVRVKEIREWGFSEEYKRIKSFLENTDAGVESMEAMRCSACGKEVEENWAFCRYCGNKLK